MTTKKQKVTCSSTGNNLKIFINGLLHLSVNIYEIRGLKSEIQSPHWFTISYYVKETEIECQYGNKQIWTDILTLLNEHIV